MAVLSLILFALSGNLDNLVIGLAYGMRGIRIRLEAGVLISGLVLAGTAVSMALGQSLLCFLPLDYVLFRTIFWLVQKKTACILQKTK